MHSLMDVYTPGRHRFRQRHILGMHFRHLQYEPMPIDFIFRLFLAIAKGCRFLRSKGLVHLGLNIRDVYLMRNHNPQDSVMGDWGILPMIGDFGNAMPVRPVRYDNPIDFHSTHTSMYAAPEQFVTVPPHVVDPNDNMASHTIDEKADVFSIAMTMWSFMLLGSLGFAGGPLWPYSTDWRLRYPGVGHEVPYIQRWMTIPGASAANVANDNFWNLHWHNHAHHLRTYLRYILESCLRRTPADRWSLDALIRALQLYTMNHPIGAPDPQKFAHWFT